MGVEQKPLFVTQVDKLEAKIQVKPSNITNLNEFRTKFMQNYFRLFAMKACWRVNHPTLHTLRFVISCETFTLVTRKKNLFSF